MLLYSADAAPWGTPSTMTSMTQPTSRLRTTMTPTWKTSRISAAQWRLFLTAESRRLLTLRTARRLQHCLLSFEPLRVTVNPTILFSIQLSFCALRSVYWLHGMAFSLRSFGHSAAALQNGRLLKLVQNPLPQSQCAMID